MSSRLLLALLLSGAGPLVAQVPEAALRNRLVNLHARRAELLALVERRDSLRRYEQELVPVGRPPLTFLVPVWAAAASRPKVDSVLADWEGRIGPVFTRAPAETIAVPFREDTIGFTGEQVKWVKGALPNVVLYNTIQASTERVRREVGGDLVRWLGNELPSSRRGVARREGILALARDTSGAGARCLEGIAASCLEVMGRENTSGYQIRRAFADWAISEAGVAGWERLTADPAGDPVVRIAALVGGDPVSAVGRWITAIRDPSSSATRNAAGFHLLALAWTVGLMLLFLWRLTWHRA